MEPPEPYRGKPADFLAVERTFLAWIRTGLALMALGFVLARFGLFLHEFNIARSNAPQSVVEPVSYGYSVRFGTGLILLGVLVSILSLVRYLRLIAQLKSGTGAFDNTSNLAVAIAILLGLLGLAMSYYVVATRNVSGPNLSSVKEAPMPAAPEAVLENGIVRIPSHHSVDETVAKLQTILQAKNVKLFAVVDHSGEAENAGLRMPNTKLLIFGNPKAGTPLMLASPSVALDFPLKILVAEDTAGKVWVSYNAPDYLQKRHNLPTNLLPNIAVIDALATNAAQ
jgi:uncharacterized protein (DUF302 family)/uncharacterized membrane protein YidH (DUF202 family)